ncbi:MAG: hypothetical protein ACHQYP_10685 [Nitrospiria bacterium]
MINKIKDDVLNGSEGTVSRSLTIIFFLVIIGSTAIFITKILFAIIHGSTFEGAAGVWTSLAVDFSKGIFYRPVFSESVGYGGTRYFPLSFSLQALFLRLTGKPILSGHLVSLLAGILLLVGCYLLLRLLGTGLLPALALSLALPASSSVQFSLEGMRGDILPLALNLFGFVFFLSKLPQKFSEILTALCFTLAFSAKITAIHGIVSLFLWLFLSGRKKEALRILFITSAGYLIFLMILYYGTSGRIIEIFKVSSSAGTNFYTLGRAPFRFLNEVRFYDPVCLLLLFSTGVVVAFYKFKRVAVTLQGIFLGVSVLITVFIFGSPGVQFNHFVDVMAASLLLIGSTVFHNEFRNLRSLIFAYFVLIFISVAFTLTDLKQIVLNNETKTVCRNRIVDLIKQREGPVISDNALFPIMAGRSSYILDSFLFPFIIRHDETLKAPLLRRIDQKEFSTIVKQAPLLKQDHLINKELDSDQFGFDMMNKVLSSYNEEDRCGDFVVYAPR